MPDQNDAVYFAARAVASRAAAERARDPAAQAIYIRMATRYDQLAIDPHGMGAVAQGDQAQSANMPNPAS